KHYDPETRNTLFILQNARTDDQKVRHAERGAYISEIVYQAKDLQRAWDDALWAGMEAIAEPAEDSLTGAQTGYLREPCGGNAIELREVFRPQ
ncbi:MAG: glyoxalase, partial [Gammaproteobacteria bacterium]|nr:glyoxalase [Gammaproteobacteria bacterium]